MRRKRSRRSAGNGRLYQSRYKSFLIQRDENLLTVLRYVERTPLAAGLVEKAQLWQFAQPAGAQGWPRGNQDSAGALAGRAAVELDGSGQCSSLTAGTRSRASEHRTEPPIWARMSGCGGRPAGWAWNTRFDPKAGHPSWAILTSGPAIRAPRHLDHNGGSIRSDLQSPNGPDRNQDPAKPGQIHRYVSRVTIPIPAITSAAVPVSIAPVAIAGVSITIPGVAITGIGVAAGS